MAANYDEVEDLILAYNDADVIDVDEALLLHDIQDRRNPHFPYWTYEKFDLGLLQEDECKAEFRLLKNDVLALHRALRFPEQLKCYNGVVVDSVEALCVCLRRLAFPCRYGDLVPRFARPVPQLSMITNMVIDDIYERYGNLLLSLDQPWLSRGNLKSFADAIHAKGAALTNCWGFVDGTVRPICRPSRNQRIVYNGHKRVHALKFQSVVAPNGLIANLYGPIEGRRHDAAMLAMSGLMGELEQYSFAPDGEALCIYGDPAYPHRIHLQCPFQQRQGLTPEQQAFNHSMSQVRVSVEWVFKEIVTYFKFIDFKKDLKIGLSPVGKTYAVCALLQNAITCLYGSNTAQYFGIEPPTLEFYFNGQ